MKLQNVDLIASLLGGWSAELNTGSVLLRILLSVILAAVIGWERSSKRHSAGLRTFILVSLASTAAMLTDLYLLRFGLEPFPAVSAAAVIGAAMISGNSVLFNSRSQIKGLTTSVGLWLCGLMGLAMGAGLYTVTLILFAALFASLSLFPSIEKYLKDQSNHFEIHLELKNRGDLQDFAATVRRLGICIDDLEFNSAYLNSGLSVYTVSLTVSSAELKKYKKHSEIIEALRSLEYVSHIEEIS
ncbi:MAG: MgtC/SapB family protein [Oscillibacter sp.]|jgi:putative Mg2+ transporter-C (MgtC) family protein|nr:MgtC/SapB family protein [Oscillibacter sp.]